MKKIFLSSIITFASAFAVQTSLAQATVAMDFNRADCNGNMHHLFTNDLDSGNVVIIEFFMGGGCTPCITAGHTLETMKAGLLAAHPGKIRSYTTGFQNSMDCSVVTAWVTTNGFTSTPIDSGAAQLAHYGSFGMPTIVILAGTAHKVIYYDEGFSAGDTVGMKDSINSFFNPGAAGIKENQPAVGSISLVPNPAANVLHMTMQVTEAGELTIEITDVTGKVHTNVAKEYVTNGSFSRDINVSTFASGLYLVRATVNGRSSVSKLTIAK